MAAPAFLPAFSRLFNHIASAACAGVLLFAITSARAAKWSPPDPTELAETSPRVEPEAGAEILLREVTVLSYNAGISARIRTYIRIKIFNQRGVEASTLIQIPYTPRTKFRDIAARTVKPDGTILELPSTDIYDREILKAGKFRQKVKSFAPLGVEPGVIIEYEYTVQTSGYLYPYMMTFQGELPARLVRYRFDGKAHSEYRMRPNPFNAPGLNRSRDASKFEVYQIAKIPAWKDEPFQAPEMNCQPVVLLSSRYDTFSWYKKNIETCDELDKKTKLTKTITDTLATIVAPADSAEEKLRKIYDYCRTKILNHDRDTTRLTDAQWEALNRNATDTLKAGHGTARDINDVFAALVRAAGFEATIALCNDRSTFFLGFIKNDRALPRDEFVYRDAIVAVRDKEKKYRLFDPGASYLPFEELAWKNSETAMLVTQRPRLDQIFFSAPPASASHRKREAAFTIDADGTLEGDVSIEYTGLWQAEVKDTFDNATDEERADAIKAGITDTLKQADVTQIKILNADQPHLPLTVTYHLRVPDYAERTGSRLFLQPAVFHKGAAPTFTAPERKTAILFPYRLTEEDKISIQFPDGYEIEAGSSPGNRKFENFGQYETSIALHPKKHTLVLTRRFVRTLIAAPATDYPQIKEATDTVHARDNHVLTFKRKAAPAE